MKAQMGGDTAPPLKIALRYFRDLGGALLRDLRKAGLGSTRPISQAHRFAREAEILRCDGIVIIPDFLPVDWTQVMRAKVLAVLENDRSSRKLPSGAVVRNRDDEGMVYDVGMIDVMNPHLEIPGLSRFANDPRVLEIVELASGQKFHLDRTHAYVNQNSIRPRGYHLDNYHFGQFKAFLLLGDLPDVSHGPYSYIRGSHRFSGYKYGQMLRGALKGLDWGNMDSTKRDAEVICSGSAGTLVITDQNGFHRGQIQRQGTRVMLVNDYEL